MTTPAITTFNDWVELAHVVLDVVGPFLGAALGYWLRGREFLRSEHSQRVEEISRELEALTSTTAAYWSRDTLNVPDTNLDIAQEGEMLGRVHAINILVEDIAPAIKGDSKAVMRGLIIELRQAVTGADFAATKGHGRSASAISGVFRVAAELRAILHRSLR